MTTDDLIDQAELCASKRQYPVATTTYDMLDDLVAALKAARAENERLRAEFATYATFAEQEFERLQRGGEVTDVRAQLADALREGNCRASGSR